MEKAIFTTTWLKAIGNNSALKNQLCLWYNAVNSTYKSQFISITANCLSGNYRTKTAL